MDMKCITWVGNLYQKFEALCLEVEDNVYEDTVKYAENQVQTVNASVKKFYSDVMQDLLPPSPMDPIKEETEDLPLKKYADTKIYKKSEEYAQQKHVKVGIYKKNKDSNMVKHAGRVSSADGQECVNYSSVRVRGNFDKEEHHVGKDFNTPSPICEFPGKTLETSCEQIDVVSCPASNGILGHESKGEEKEAVSDKDIGDASNGADDVSIGRQSSNTELNAMSSEKRMVSSMEHSTNEDIQHSNFANMEDMMPKDKFGGSDGWDIDPFECIDEIEQGMETIHVMKNLNIAESCVVVDGDRFRLAPHTERKQKSYKKKIRDAFSLKTKSARKHEYEQLASRYKDLQASSNVRSDQNLQALDISESEWEIL